MYAELDGSLASFRARVGGNHRVGAQVIIACTSRAAHLPSNIADLPVTGVPRDLGALEGIDALLSMVQMPEGAPVAVMAIGETGAVNAAIHAAKELAIADPAIKGRLLAYAEKRKARVHRQNQTLAQKWQGSQ